MTKIEYGKCQKLMYDAIRLLRQSEEEYKEANTYIDMDSTKQKIAQGKADQHYGEAIGINQVLATIGFNHNDMKILSELL